MKGTGLCRPSSMRGQRRLGEMNAVDGRAEAATAGKTALEGVLDGSEQLFGAARSKRQATGSLASPQPTSAR